MKKTYELTKEQIIIRDNALLIAKFEGYETEENSIYGNIYYSEDNERTALDTAYHNSWDWLMPVIKKIDSYANEKLSFSKFDDYRTNWAMINRPSKYDIDNVYKQVIQFIEWYNGNKLNENQKIGQSTII